MHAATSGVESMEGRVRPRKQSFWNESVLMCFSWWKQIEMKINEDLHIFWFVDKMWRFSWSFVVRSIVKSSAVYNIVSWSIWLVKKVKFIVLEKQFEIWKTWSVRKWLFYVSKTWR